MTTPHEPDTFLNAIKAVDEQRYDDALALCAQLLEKNSTHLNALTLSALIFEEINQIDVALSYCAAILLINPNNANILTMQGVLFIKQLRFEDAKKSFDQSLAINANDIKTLQNYGLTLIQLNQYENALLAFDSALAIDPNNCEILINKAFILLELHRYQEALESYDKAFRINPIYPEAISDRGNALIGLKRYDEALASYAWALSVNSDCKLAHYSEGYCRLLMGDLLNGWQKYEYRWDVTQSTAKRNFAQPLWLGEKSIHGKIILIHAEQGHGDAMQFSRYIPMLHSLGATVYLEAYPDLKPILEPLVKPNHFITRGQSLPDVDYHCPFLSLPLAFKTQMENIPNATPYLTSTHTLLPNDSLLLPHSTKPRIGIVWQANEANQRLLFRSIPFNQLLNVVTDKYLFVVIQKKVSDHEMSLIAQNPNIIDMHNHIHTFGDTAAIINQLDLVIAVDTSVAHLAGAMNKPVWILLSENANWRWFIDREDSPWYPSATLFRQTEFGKWDNVIDNLNKALADYF